MTSGDGDGRESVDRIEQLPVSDWTDQDLLTKNEARGRLVDEIGRCRARLDELKANNADESELALLARRLNAMESIAGEYDEYLDGK
jgi:chorismate mutase